MKMRRNRACSMPATGERAPARTLVAVRARAPVAGSPPNSAEATFATPWATSSQLERCRPPIMPSATTAESSDSIPARKAIVKELGNSSRVRSNGMCGITRCGNCARKSPKAGADRFHRQADQRARKRGRCQGDQKPRPRRAPATQPDDQGEAGERDQGRPEVEIPEVLRVEVQAREELRRHRAHVQSEQILDLAQEDADRDTRGEAGNDRLWHIFHQGADAQYARGDQHQAGEQGAQQQAPVTELVDHVEYHRDKRSRRSADLYA